jgi:RimJ/RimL family protein N-acetyltransferase
MTELLTPRLRLRPFRDGDLVRMVEALGDWAVSQWLDTPPYPYSEENGWAWIATVDADHAGGSPRYFAVAERESDRLLGCISLEGEGPGSSFGYWYHPDAWGRGIATEAGGAFLAYARDGLGLVRVGSRTDPDNLSSQRVLTKLGFTRTGEQPIDPPTRRGVPRIVCFELSLDA